MVFGALFLRMVLDGWKPIDVYWKRDSWLEYGTKCWVLHGQEDFVSVVSLRCPLDGEVKPFSFSLVSELYSELVLVLQNKPEEMLNGRPCGLQLSEATTLMETLGSLVPVIKKTCFRTLSQYSLLNKLYLEAMFLLVKNKYGVYQHTLMENCWWWIHINLYIFCTLGVGIVDIFLKIIPLLFCTT